MNSEPPRGTVESMSLFNGHSEQELGIPLMENGGSSILACPNVKSYAVSAFRDFPEACGPFGSADGTSVEDKTEECLGIEAVSPNLEDDSQHFEVDQNLFDTETLEQTSDCSLEKEELVVLSDQVDVDTLANNEAAKVALVDMETSDMEFATEVKKEDHMVSSHQVDQPTLDNAEQANVALADMDTLDAEFATGDMEFATEVKKEDQVSSHQVDQPTLDNDEQANVALAEVETLDAESSKEIRASNVIRDGMEESVPKRYPSRARVAAIRDFPRLCGRNAPLLTNDECVKELSSLNKRRVGQTDVKEVDSNKRKLANIVQADSEGTATQRVKKMDVGEPSSEMRLTLDNIREKKNTQLSEKYNHHQVNINPKAMVKKENTNTVQAEETSGRKIMLGLMSKSECHGRSDISSLKFKPVSIGGTDESKGKKVDFYARVDRSKTAVKTKHVPDHSEHVQLKKKSNSDDMGELVRRENNSLDPNKKHKTFQSVPKSHGVNVPPLGRENDSIARNKVKNALRLFQAVSRSLSQEAEAKAKSNEKERRRFDLQAAKILKEEGNYVNEGDKILGPVSGVEVGDKFQYRIELNIIGLHRQIQGGIDYVKHRNKILATSIVASGGYYDELDNTDVLIYTGQGGNVMSNDKDPEDQKLERGNLALKNSSEEKNPVRVIRGSDSMDGKYKIYVYDGLYLVESCWQEMGSHGKLVYKFRMRKIPGQPKLASKDVKQSIRG